MYEKPWYNNEKRKCNEEKEQTHLHEFEGSTRLAEEGEDRHNHRTAGISGPAIRCGNNHIHLIKTTTDFTAGHFHEICIRTGPGIIVNPCEKNPRHVHLVEGMTEIADGHRHDLKFATQVESIIDPLV